MTVRSAAVQDAAVVTEVLCLSRRQYLPFAPLIHTDEEVREWIGDVLIPGNGVYVAEREDKVVAVLAISHDQVGGWVDQLYVRPGYTGQGIGELLLQFAHTKLTPPIRLYTFQANAGARRFYERHGYRALSFTDGSGNEERCPDVLYEWRGAGTAERTLARLAARCSVPSELSLKLLTQSIQHPAHFQQRPMAGIPSPRPSVRGEACMH